MKLFTIGFTKVSAEEFFGRLRRAGVRRIVDIRLNNVSQLAGFAKRDDLAFFLREICEIEYHHVPSLAPTKAMLDAYRKKKLTWSEYERQYIALIDERAVAAELDRSDFEQACLLCSEATPEKCHRRLAGEYLAKHWLDVTVTHL